MGINLIAPGSASPTAALFYDTGAFGATAKMTKVGQNTVSAAVEIKSTTGALLVPRMTTNERIALPVPVDGMEVYDTDIGEFMFTEGGVWVRKANFSNLGILYRTGNLTLAQLLTMNSAPTTLLVAPGAGFMYVIHRFMLNVVYGTALFASAGTNTIYLKYGAAPFAVAGFLATLGMNEAILTATNANKSSAVAGDIASTQTVNSDDAVISIVNATADFTVGTGNSAAWQIWYSIVPVL